MRWSSLQEYKEKQLLWSKSSFYFHGSSFLAVIVFSRFFTHKNYFITIGLASFHCSSTLYNNIMSTKDYKILELFDFQMVLKVEYYSVLLFDFEFKQIDRAIDPWKIALKLGPASYEHKYGLSQLRDIITNMLWQNKLFESRW